MDTEWYFPVDKASEIEVNYSHSYIAEVNNSWRLSSLSIYNFMA
jgi:hypothetical protein